MSRSGDATEPLGEGSSGAIPNVGERVDNFIIERLLGTGGFGTVFEATDTLTERKSIFAEEMKYLVTGPRWVVAGPAVWF